MLINTQLIQDYLDASFTAEEIQAALMRAGLEVEESYELSDVLKDVRIGFVRDIAPLKGSQTNHLCRVDVGQGEPVPIVCGSEHEVKVGWGVPVALPGTRLPGRKHAIEKTTIGDQASFGMICLDGEMGMKLRSTGLQVFDDSTAPGARLVELIELDERLLELSVLPNRPDCLGLIGIARELAAVLGCGVVYPDTRAGGSDESGADAPVAVTIEDAGRCSRYQCAAFEGIRVAKSPGWLKNALLTLGARPINNVVDITNFVMFEWGNPLHAFDLETLGGAQVRVRRAKPGESMRLLDGAGLKLSEEDLVIADAERPIALAGVMGGEGSQTRPDTTRVLLEAAHFEPTGIRATRRRLNLSTDSSYRFERGTDPNRMLTGAFERAASLLQEVAGGKRIGGATDCRAGETRSRVFELPVKKVGSYLGSDIPADQIVDALTRLGMGCKQDNGSVRVEAPTWRVDADDPVVLIEDVARIIGYESISSQAPAETRTAGKRSRLDGVRDALAVYLSSQGFSECRTLPLVDASRDNFFEQGRQPLALKNPMKEDESVLRRSLLPALIAAVDQNARRATGRSRFYEIDRIFHTVDGAPHEAWGIAGVLGGPAHDRSWSKGRSIGFHEAKGVVENVLEIMHVPSPEFAHQPLPGMKAGATAVIRSGGEEIGYLGQIDQRAVRGLHINDALFGFQLSLEHLWEAGASAYSSLPRYPGIDRDLAMIVDRATEFGQIEQAVYRAVKQTADAEGGSGLTAEDLESFWCFDRYEGKGVPSGKLSLGLRFMFRSPTRTLKTEEVDRVINAIITALGSEFGAELRQ